MIIPVPAEALAEAKANPGRKVIFDGRGQAVWAVTAEEGVRRGRPSGVQVEHRDGRTDAHVVCDGIRETIHLSDYGFSRQDVDDLKRLLTRGTVRRVAGPAPHQVASGLHVPRG